MKPASLERVFGRSRLKMVTGPYVEVYREAAAPGERRRYTKRFLATKDGDFREWTQREWRILARLVGHGARHVPDVVQYDRGAAGGDALVQTYDAGVTLYHWVTLLPVERDGRAQLHIFQDCAHWWALARQLLLALHEIHVLRLVHLDLKADNICLPMAPPYFDPAAGDQRLFPVFEQLALIDFAFALISGEGLTRPLPIGWQRTFPYQSPRLLQALVAGQQGDLEPTKNLDWRCDMFSLAALLRALLPGAEDCNCAAQGRGWTDKLHIEAKWLLLKIQESHDRDIGPELPHLALAATCSAQLETADLAHSMQRSWNLARDVDERGTAEDSMATTAPLTRVTLVEPLPVFSAATAVLPQRDSDDIPQEVDAAVACHERAEGFEPLPTVTLPAAYPMSAVSRPPAPASSPVADGHGGQIADAAWLITSASPDERPARLEQPVGTTAATAAPPLPRLPSPVMSSQAPAPQVVDAGTGAQVESPPTADAAGKRPSGAYALPVLVAVMALTWWSVRNTGPGVGETLMSSAPLVTADAGKAAERTVSVRAPAPAGSQPGRIDRGDAAGIPVAASPSMPDIGQPPIPPANSGPPLQAARAPGETTPSTAPPAGRFAHLEQDNPSRMVLPVLAPAEQRVAQVLSLAARAQHASDDRLTVAAARSIGNGISGPLELRTAAAPVKARQLNAAAQRAFYEERNAVRAYELQRQAFRAQPADVEIAGNLAFYALKMDPPLSDESRALAIYALVLSTRARGQTRTEDWGNLAVASALSGRAGDAINAMLVLLSVSRDPNRSCHSALASVASHGPAMRLPAEALLARAQDRVDVAAAPKCRWPPAWR